MVTNISLVKEKLLLFKLHPKYATRCILLKKTFQAVLTECFPVQQPQVTLYKKEKRQLSLQKYFFKMSFLAGV